jgi:predicted XRE-type DNA-binding protein
MTEIEPSSGNVYADLQIEDANAMLIKATLVSSIDSIIRHRHLSRESAAEFLDVSETQLADLLRGQFRDGSTDKLISYLNRLGRDVEIVVSKAPQKQRQGRLSVRYADTRKRNFHADL